jgi:hypothetical protein
MQMPNQKMRTATLIFLNQDAVWCSRTSAALACCRRRAYRERHPHARSAVGGNGAALGR